MRYDVIETNYTCQIEFRVKWILYEIDKKIDPPEGTVNISFQILWGHSLTQSHTTSLQSCSSLQVCYSRHNQAVKVSRHETLSDIKVTDWSCVLQQKRSERNTDGEIYWGC
jgi:hypothetical protein